MIVSHSNPRVLCALLTIGLILISLLATSWLHTSRYNSPLPVNVPTSSTHYVKLLKTIDYGKPDKLGMSLSKEDVIAQRNEISRHLDRVLQQLGQLQCTSEVDTGEREASGGQVTGTGAWCRKYSSAVGGEHLTDTIWTPHLAEFFRNQTVASFGEGPGLYKQLLDETGKLRAYDGYDGAPFAEEVSVGAVKHLDLSVERYGLPVYDWVMSLEVAEHIPAQHEDAFLSNLVRHARRGILMSWALPVPGGFYHVNGKTFDYVEKRMLEHGFTYNASLTELAVKHTSYPHLHNSVKAYIRTRELPESTLRDLA